MNKSVREGEDDVEWKKEAGCILAAVVGRATAAANALLFPLFLAVSVAGRGRQRVQPRRRRMLSSSQRMPIQHTPSLTLDHQQ